MKVYHGSYIHIETIERVYTKSRGRRYTKCLKAN